MMSDPAAPELVQARRTKHGSLALRVVVGAALVVAIVWVLRARQQEHSVATDGDPSAARSGSAPSRGAASSRDGDAGSEGRVVTVQVANVERKDLPIWLEGLGTVAAVQQVTVRPQVDG